MGNEIILKKIERIEELLLELDRFLSPQFRKFIADVLTVRAAERDFQLLVDLASDINTHIVVARGGRTPDTYKESFVALSRAKVLNWTLTRQLVKSAELRNILVHEYDFEEDYEKFYTSAKKFLPLYREYVRTIYKYAKKTPAGV